MAMKQINFRRDIDFEERYRDKVKNALKDYFFQQDFLKDVQEATDFTILPGKVAVRIRRFEYLKKEEYREQFTIRWSRPSGIDTEIHKIRKGLVDYFLYGFLSENEDEIIQYFIGDLKFFHARIKPLYVFLNKDASSELAVYEIRQFLGNFVVAYDGLPENLIRWIERSTSKNYYDKQEHIKFLQDLIKDTDAVLEDTTVVWERKPSIPEKKVDSVGGYLDRLKKDYPWI